MGTWNTAIKDNDTFQDIYHHFFDLYNQGQTPSAVSKQILEEYKVLFDDHDDRNNGLFGLALAQWETSSLDAEIHKEVKHIIEGGGDITKWKELGADEKTLKKRSLALAKFLVQISTERVKPKPRIRPRGKSKSIELFRITAPDNNKVFEASEHYANGVYMHTGSLISWKMGGGSVFYFEGQGKSIEARWIDSQTLEVTYEKDIIFTKKEKTFYFFGDQVKIIYIPK